MTTAIQGLSWQQHFTSYASAQNWKDDVPDDLTGWTVKAAIRSQCKELLLQLPIQIIQPTLGKIWIDVKIPLTLPTGVHYWSAVLTDPTGRDFILQPLEPIQILPAIP